MRAIAAALVLILLSSCNAQDDRDRGSKSYVFSWSDGNESGFFTKDLPSNKEAFFELSKNNGIHSIAVDGKLIWTSLKNVRKIDTTTSIGD